MKIAYSWFVTGYLATEYESSHTPWIGISFVVPFLLPMKKIPSGIWIISGSINFCFFMVRHKSTTTPANKKPVSFGGCGLFFT